MTESSKPLMRARLCLALCKDHRALAYLHDPLFWQAALHEGVHALVWSLWRSSMPTSILQKQQSLLQAQIVWLSAVQRAQQRLVRLAEQRCLGLMILRGQSLAAQLYTDARLRPQTDIDVLLHATVCAEDARRLFADAGFVPVQGHPHLWKQGTLLLDHHDDLLGVTRIPALARATDFDAELLWRQASFSTQRKLIVADDVSMLAYLSFHVLKHSYTRLLWLYDIALYCSHMSEENWDALLVCAQKHRLQLPLYMALSYVAKHLQAKVPDAVLHNLRGKQEPVFFATFMQHRMPVYLAERLFVQMMPNPWSKLCLLFDVVFPRGEAADGLWTYISKRWTHLLCFIGSCFRH